MATVQCFGEFELDPLRFELRRAGTRVSMQPKALRLLLYLVEHHQRSVSNQELLKELWPSEAVTPASIRRAVAGARRALGERGDCESSIQTVRDHGYRFLLEVHAASPAPRTLSPSACGAVAPAGERDERAKHESQFVGREHALGLLDAALMDSLAGRSRCLWIGGEPGIGKSRLVQELAARARALGAATWCGRCMDVEGAPPLWPLIQMLREAREELGVGAFSAALGAGASDIAQALPELLVDEPAAAVPGADGSRARFRLFDGLARFFARVAAERPLVVAFDDLERADAATLRLVCFLVGQLAETRILFAITVRQHSRLDARSRELLRAIAREPSVRSVELVGFGREELARYLRLRVGAEAPPSVVTHLHEQTGGNPLFVEQLLSGLNPCALTGRFQRLLTAPADIGLHGSIERHLDGLGTEAHALLQAASVLGREFSLATLARMLERSPEHLLQTVARAADAGLVVEPSETLGPYRFGHSLIRDALYQALEPGERARLHGRAGLALEALGGPAQQALLPLLALHFTRAAPGHDGGRALDYTLASARSARDWLAFEDAAAHYKQALLLLEMVDSTLQSRVSLLLELADALVSVPDAVATRETVFEAAALADRCGDADALARAAQLLGRLPEAGTVDPVQVELIERALEALGPHGAERASLEALHAKALCYARDREKTRRIALSALASARTLSASERADALFHCMHGLTGPESLPERLNIADELASLGDASGDLKTLQYAAFARVWTQLELGDMAAVSAAIDALESFAETARDPVGCWHYKMFRAMRALVGGHLALASRLARGALDHGTKLGEAMADHVHATQQLGVLRLQGRQREAELLVRAVVARHPTLAGWQVALAELHADQGRSVEARAVLDRMFERDLDHVLRDPFTFGVLAPLADLCASVGDAAQAELLYNVLLPYAERTAVVSIASSTHGPLARHLGRLALSMGESEKAEHHLQRAIALSERMRAPAYVSLSYLSYAQLTLLRGGPSAREQGRERIAHASAIANEYELAGIVGYCGALAEAFGLPVLSLAPRSA